MTSPGSARTSDSGRPDQRGEGYVECLSPRGHSVYPSAAACGSSLTCVLQLTPDAATGILRANSPEVTAARPGTGRHQGRVSPRAARSGEPLAPTRGDLSVNEATAYIELAASPVTPSWARRHAQAVLGAWQLPPGTIETAVLLISELVTNAVAATAALAPGAPAANVAPITQTLRLRPGRIVIEVTDPDPSPPVPERAGPDAESGRGLMIIDMLSKEWSYFCPPSSGGKTVYCVIAVES
jgi:anti-sigma regulatory factor (Ser/Thr protein kinase)